MKSAQSDTTAAATSKNSKKPRSDNWVGYGVNESKCNICDKTFINRVALKEHVSSSHSSDDAQDWLEHGVTKSQCTICDRTFINKVALKSHFVSQHPDDLDYYEAFLK